MSRFTRPGLLALLGIVLVSLGMRSPTTSFTPLFELVSGELGMGPVVLGVVGAMPPFAFAIAGTVTPWLAHRWGAERALVGAIAAILVGQVARAASGEAFGVVVSTAVTMLGIGVGNVLLPSFVKRYFPDRVGVLTAIYTTLFAIGATSAAFLVVPVADVLTWRPTLILWVATVALGLIPWIALARRTRTADLEVTELPDVPDLAPANGADVRVTRTPIAWALVAVLWASAMVGYGGGAWLPVILTSRAGLSAAEAGAHLGIMLLIGIPSSVLVPFVASRARVAAAIVALSGLLGSAGWIGLLVAPAAAPAVWCALVGCGGLTFTLVLVQVVVRASSARVAVRLSAFVQTAAYILTGVTVLVLGVLHDATGDWVAPIGVFIAVALLPIVAAGFVARPAGVDETR